MNGPAIWTEVSHPGDFHNDGLGAVKREIRAYRGFMMEVIESEHAQLHLSMPLRTTFSWRVVPIVTSNYGPPYGNTTGRGSSYSKQRARDAAIQMVNDARTREQGESSLPLPE